MHHGERQNDGSGSDSTGYVAGHCRNFLDMVGAESLVGFIELDVPGDGHAVVGDRRRAPLLVQDDVAPLGTEGHLHRVGEGVDATLQGAPSLLVERKDLRHGFSSSDHLVTTARMSRALSSSSSLPSYLTSVPPYLLKITTSPSATSSGTRLP